MLDLTDPLAWVLFVPLMALAGSLLALVASLFNRDPRYLESQRRQAIRDHRDMLRERARSRRLNRRLVAWAQAHPGLALAYPALYFTTLMLLWHWPR